MKKFNECDMSKAILLTSTNCNFSKKEDIKKFVKEKNEGIYTGFATTGEEIAIIFDKNDGIKVGVIHEEKPNWYECAYYDLDGNFEGQSYESIKNKKEIIKDSLICAEKELAIELDYINKFIYSNIHNVITERKIISIVKHAKVIGFCVSGEYICNCILSNKEYSKHIKDISKKLLVLYKKISNLKRDQYFNNLCITELESLQKKLK